MNKELSPEFSTKQKAIVVEWIKEVDPLKHSMHFGQMIMEISKQFQINPINQIEKILREMGSNTYLLAMPFTPEMDNFVAKMAYPQDIRYPYYLWICVNGKEEAEEKMREIETNIEQNLDDLNNAGILVPKPGTDVSRSLKSHLN